MDFLYGSTDEGGPAGDTGSAMHAAAAAFHRGVELSNCLDVMKEGLPKYPLADLRDAADMFLRYADDPRNAEAEVVLVEHPVRFALEPAATDETKARIEVEGTLDQLRRVNGVLRLHDIKTSKKDGMVVLRDSMFQIAAYCVGAAILMNEPVQPGPLILPRMYQKHGKSSAPAFWHYAWTWDDVEHILDAVRNTVADVRAGRITHMPTDDCRWCPARTPDVCLPKLIQLRKDYAANRASTTGVA